MYVYVFVFKHICVYIHTNTSNGSSYYLTRRNTQLFFGNSLMEKKTRHLMSEALRHFSGTLQRCCYSFIKVSSVFYVYGSVHCWSTLIIVQRDATQSSLYIILQVYSTCFGCQPHPSSGVHKTVTTAMLEGDSCTKNMTSTGGCSYIFVYSWWWV